MTDNPLHLITVTWSVTRDERDAYVMEFTDGQLSLTYGPMALDVVEPFLLERKQAVAEIFDRVIRRLNDGKDKAHQDEPLAR